VKRPIKFKVQSKLLTYYKKIQNPWHVLLTCGHGDIVSEKDANQKTLNCTKCQSKPKQRSQTSAKPIKRPKRPKGGERLRKI